MTDPKIYQVSDVDRQLVTDNELLEIVDGKLQFGAIPVLPGNSVGAVGDSVGGSLSDITYTGSQAISGVIRGNNITINSGVTLTVTQGRSVYFKANGNFTNNGIINADGSGHAGAASFASVVIDGPRIGCSAGGGGGGGKGGVSAGKDGGDGSNRISMYGGNGGGTGGTGGTGGGGNAGSGTSASGSRPTWLDGIDGFVPSDVFPGGTGGAGGYGDGGAGGAGGAGGNGGGVIIIQAVGDVVEGQLSANGNDGIVGTFNAGGSGGGGGGGGGGYVLVLYQGQLTTGTVTVSGGLGNSGGGAGAGDGGDGEDGIVRRVKMS